MWINPHVISVSVYRCVDKVALDFEEILKMQKKSGRKNLNDYMFDWMMATE